MEKQKYTLGFIIITVDGSRFHETATTLEDEGLVNAENNIAWRYVVKDNPKAKYAGGIIRFDGSGREINGNRRSLKHTRLYMLLKEDLMANGILVSEKQANELRQKFRMTRKNYNDVLVKIIHYLKEEDVMENTVVENKVESAVENVNIKEENNMDDKKLREWIEECLDYDDKTFEIIYRGVHLKLEVYSYYDERYDGEENEISVYVKSWRLTDEKEEILGAESYDDSFDDETVEDILDAFHEVATTEDKNESANVQKKEDVTMEEKKYLIDEDDLKNMLAYCSMEEVRVLTEIVDHFDNYKFVKAYEETYSHDAPEDMGEEWDSDKETRTIIGFTINEKQGWLTACDSECGYFNGVQLDFDGQEIDLPFAGYWFGQEIHKNPAVLKQYLEEVLQIIEKEIGTRELMRRDDFAHVLCSSLIKNKEPQEKHDYERILYALKDNGFHVAMTDVDTSIKGDHIALLYEDDIAPMVTFDIANLPAIKFGRELYKFLALNVKTEESKKVQQTLITMFSGKQKTTDQPKTENVENKTAQSAPKKEEKNMTNEWEDLANLENTCSAKEKHADNIVAKFSMRQNGVETPTSVSLSVWGKKAEDPAYIFKGGIFDKGKYVGYWKWDIREKGGFKCPCFVTTNNVFYSYHEDKDGNPTSNTSRMLLAIAEALGKARGIKSGATYKQKRLGGNTGVMDFTAPAEYDGAPTRVENIRPIRPAAGQAEQELPVTPEKESPLPTQSDFWGEAI